MNRTDFLQTLRDALHMLPMDEREDAVNYFGELIEDKMSDNGCTEREAIDSLGRMDEIVASVMDARTEHDHAVPHTEPVEGANEQTSHGIKTVTVKAAAVRQIMIRGRNCPIEISRGGSEEIVLRYLQDEYRQFDFSLEQGELRLIQQPQTLFSLFGIRQLFSDKSFITLTVPAELAAALDAQTSNSHMQMDGISVWGALRLSTSNSSISVTSASAKAMDITTSNGRLTAEGLQVSGPITLRTSNARLEAHQIEAGEALTLRTSNGKIVFSELNGTGITMHTSNATVDGSLPHAANHYSVTSATSNGSNTLKHHAHQGPVPLDVRTSNSAIRVSFTDNA